MGGPEWPRIASGRAPEDNPSTDSHLRNRLTLDAYLFAATLAVFVATRLYGLEQFPIYFLSDEAVHTVSAADLLHNGFRSSSGEFLPTYFQNDQWLNLSVSVYLQVIPYWLFGFSELATRATFVLIAGSATVAIGLTLRDAFRVRFWWAASLLLVATPAWFLHSRAALEPVLAASFYAWFLFFWFRIRTSATWNLYPALLFAALAFYSYATSQIVVGATLLGFVLSDFRLLCRHPRATLRGLVLGAALALPYVRFQIAHPGEIAFHLRALDSYWTTDASLAGKLRRFLGEYWHGLSPSYWFSSDNGQDLVRHQMKGWGHILPITLPFLVAGIVVCLTRLRSSSHRALLIATCACPLGGALVEPFVTRVLICVIPLTLLSGLGLAMLLTPLAARTSYRACAAAVFILFAGLSGAMLRDALVHGPVWYRDYGLYGMQYGGRQVTTAVAAYLESEPRTKFLFSPTWANGTHVLVRFFLPDEDRVQVETINPFLLSRLALHDYYVFVMTPEEYNRVLRDRRFSEVRVERIVPYPDGRPGFYFVRLRYSARADAIIAREKRERAHLVHEEITFGGQRVGVAHSLFDGGRIQDVFDGDAFTLARTLEANPAVFRLSFPQARTVRGVSVTTATMQASVRVSLLQLGKTEPAVSASRLEVVAENPTLSLPFGRATRARVVEIRVRDLGVMGPAHVHVREIKLE